VDLAATVRAKGFSGLAERVTTIGCRFGLSAEPMEQRLLRFAADAADAGVIPTFAVTAVVLGRHPRVLRDLTERGVELAVHGLVHNDHTALSPAQQASAVLQAREVFRRHDVPTAGFRAPYLRADAATVEAVAAAGLEYDSSRAASFDVLPAELTPDAAGRVQRALAFYDALDAGRVAVRPWLQSGVVVIPVSMPDDEILVDRLHLPPEEQAQVWLTLLDATHARGELFTVQLHPERFDDCRLALAALLAHARSRTESVWTVPLLELARWWRARAAGGLQLQAAADGSVTVTAHGDDRLRVEVLGGERSQTAPARSVTLAPGPAPVVGLGPEVTATTAELLREEGFLVSAEDPSPCAVVLDREPADQKELFDRLAMAPHPLVRLARWPLGCRSALAITGDIDALTLADFVRRGPETRQVGRASTGGREVTAPAAAAPTPGAGA